MLLFDANVFQSDVIAIRKTHATQQSIKLCVLLRFAFYTFTSSKANGRYSIKKKNPWYNRKMHGLLLLMSISNNAKCDVSFSSVNYFSYDLQYNIKPSIESWLVCFKSIEWKETQRKKYIYNPCFSQQNPNQMALHTYIFQ